MSLEDVKKDLENKGWLVKNGLIYGADFILYKPSDAHSHGKYLIKYTAVLPTYREIFGFLRCVNSVKKVNAI